MQMSENNRYFSFALDCKVRRLERALEYAKSMLIYFIFFFYQQQVSLSATKQWLFEGVGEIHADE